MKSTANKRVIVIGGGPAGLTAAYELCKLGVESVVLEKDSMVGGLAKTVNYKGYHFDIGGHRFFTKVRIVDEMWREVLNNGQFLRCKRLSRIYYNKKYFNYPLKAANALFGLGVCNSFLILLSYIKAQLWPAKQEETFEQWVSNRFGKRLYYAFFKTYTEKVWGIPCSEISAEWAAQRIKGLSLITAIKNAFIKPEHNNGNGVIRTLINEFDYPERGPGMMWERVADIIKSKGSQVRLEAPVEKILWSDGRVKALQIGRDARQEEISGTHFISSMPIRELLQKLEPAVPKYILTAATNLNYRDFITVALVINKPNLFPDNWIYIHDANVRVGRIQNFKNWSKWMVPDPNKTCLGLEYFCFEGDGLWRMPDYELIQLAKRELEMLGLVTASEVEDGMALRTPKAYPVYDSGYKSALLTVRGFLNQIDNLYLVGRNGMHKYNNQDHSMLTAMLAVKNIMGASHDLWALNDNQEYQEEVTSAEASELSEVSLLATTQPRVPERKLAGAS